MLTFIIPYWSSPSACVKCEVDDLCRSLRLETVGQGIGSLRLNRGVLVRGRVDAPSCCCRAAHYFDSDPAGWNVSLHRHQTISVVLNSKAGLQSWSWSKNDGSQGKATSAIFDD